MFLQESNEHQKGPESSAELVLDGPVFDIVLRYYFKISFVRPKTLTGYYVLLRFEGFSIELFIDGITLMLAHIIAFCPVC